MQDKYQFDRPVALKISPDLDDKAIPIISDLLKRYSIDGLIATNTTLDRKNVTGHPLAAQAGGLSGVPLREKSQQILQSFHQNLQGEIPIISVGGIDSAAEAQTRLSLGASLVQIYSGLIYRGPRLVATIGKSVQL